MTRPKDYGDQFPTDTDDMLPPSPTGGFQEFDYNPQILRGIPRKIKQPTEVKPNLGTPPVISRKREVWSGVITGINNNKTVFPRRYQVTLQTGRSVEAISVQVSEYEYFGIGDSVTVIQGTTDTEFFLQGRATPKEQQVLTVRAEGAGAQLVTDNDVIDLKVEILHTPIDNTFTDDFPNYQKIKFQTLGQYVEVIEEGEVVYEISFNVTLKNVVLSDEPTSSVATYWESACWGFAADTELPTTSHIRSPAIAFNRQVGFRVSYDSTLCRARVTLYSPLQDSVLQQQSPLKMPFWSTSLKLRHSIELGTLGGVGWVKMGAVNGTHTWVGRNAGSNLKLMLPFHTIPLPAKTGAPVMVEAVNGECVKLKFSEVSKRGTFNVLAYSTITGTYHTIQFQIEGGLVWQVTDVTLGQQLLSNVPANNNVTCLDDVTVDNKPCGDV